MVLNSKYRYIGLDFETTGLDYTKDEPIQIGIIEIDAQGKIIDEYQSLIKPNKKTDELKHIVGFITGLSIQDLETAPSREEVKKEIARFFGENTIIIGHNIQFDLDFLNAYFPGLPYTSSIDTLQLAQTSIHYAQSYALDVLIEHIKSDTNFANIFKDNNHGEEKAHDAFFDTKNSIKLFLYFTKQIYQLIDTYTNLVHIILQTTSIRKDILELEAYISTLKITIQFPTLEKLSPNNTNKAKSPTGIDTDTLENQTSYYIGDIPIKQFLGALAENKQVIFAFQNIQKLDIAKAVLQEIGIKNIGFTKEEQTINQEQFKKFLNKGEFIQEEMFFVIKYLSHLKKGLGVLHLNTQYDYRIYHYIKDKRNQTKYPIILTTHHGIFTSMQENETAFAEYDICFFDVENRYKSYNFFLSSPIDLYYTLNILESFLYQEKIEEQISQTKTTPALEEFVNTFQTRIGILFMESKKLFIKTDVNYIQHDPIREHGSFHQTNLLRKQLQEKQETLKTTLSEEQYATIEKHMSHLQKVGDGVIRIFKKMYGNGDFYFTYSEAQNYTDRKEFLDIFKNKVVFFSNSNKQKTALHYGLPTIESSQSIVSMPRINNIIEHIKQHQEDSSEYSCFIFSPKKEESKKIFEDLCGNRIDKKAELLAENITGGVGKNIFKAKKTKNKILIGGFNFILYCFANKISLDDIIIFNAKGPSEQNIIDDIKRYNIS